MHDKLRSKLKTDDLETLLRVRTFVLTAADWEEGLSLFLYIFFLP